MKNSTLVAVLTFMVALLTAFQGTITSLSDMFSPNTIVWMSAVTMFAANLLTLWKQWVSALIDNIATKSMIFLLIIEGVGFANHFFDMVPLADSTAQIIRLVLTVLTLTINMLSTRIWPQKA